MSTELARQLKKRLKEKKISVATLERQAGLKPDTARNMLRGISRNPRASNLQAIAHVLECTLPQLLGTAPHQSPTDARLEPRRLEHPHLFREIILHVLDILEHTTHVPPLGTLYSLFTELYVHASQHHAQKIDASFVQWFATKKLCNNSPEPDQEERTGPN